jgi:malate dehydrogenase
MNALRATRKLAALGARAFSSGTLPDRKVAILGAAGGIGQPLGLLMKVGLYPLICSA